MGAEAPLGYTEVWQATPPPLAGSQTTVVTAGNQSSVRVRRKLATYKEKVKRTQDELSFMSFSEVITILEDDGTTTTTK